jgi:ferredoxin-type protein NapF
MVSATMTDMYRRRFLRGDLGSKHLPIRPPWAVSEGELEAACDRCGDCVRVCSERVIVQGSGGFPEMDFSERGCSLCGECLAACRGRALRGDPRTDRPWHTTAVIGAGCLAARGVVCRSCGEVCAERAIRFEVRVGGAALPRLDTERCTGCGCCVGVCPVLVIRIQPRAAAGEVGPGRPPPVTAQPNREVDST